MDNNIKHAASLIANADALLICAGAGMGVDSGLPDFRSEGGFWKAYPALERAGIEFHNIARSCTFLADPELAWGFYGHRLKLYRETAPHDGFRILENIGERLPHGAFVFTSNVDGQFQKAGFSDNQVYECHGSIHYMQCTEGCTGRIWSDSSFKPDVDAEHCRLINPLPRCPMCGGVARPNIQMFWDDNWLAHRGRGKRKQINAWLDGVKNPVTIEIGAGTTLPAVREFGQNEKIRINLAEPDIPSGKKGVALKMGGLDALRRIEAALDQLNFAGL